MRVFEDANDPMDVIGHDDEHVDFDTGIMRWNFMPHFIHHLSGGIQFHLVFNNFTK